MTVTDRLLTLLEHRRGTDPTSDTLLEAIMSAIADALDRLALVAYGDPDQAIAPGAALNDPAVAPAWALAHAALYTGGTLPARTVGETDTAWLARARHAVVYPTGIRRGSHTAIRLAVEPLLTGTKSVSILDDVGGPYDLTVRTRTSETPDAAAARAAIEGSQVSGGRPGAIRAELKLVHVTSEDPLINEITRKINLITDPIDNMTLAGVS